PKTHKSQSTVAKSGNAINSLNTSIQVPGFGKNRIHPGREAKIRYGAAIPVPNAAKTSKLSTGGMVKLAAIAALMNGAVHGVARTQAKTPLPKLPPTPTPVSTLQAALCANAPNSNQPTKFRAIACTSNTIVATNAGD